jgi:hypothetical protein
VTENRIILEKSDSSDSIRTIEKLDTFMDNIEYRNPSSRGNSARDDDDVIKKENRPKPKKHQRGTA